MTYLMYTLPNCEHCHEAVEIFIKKKISFEKINVGIDEGLTGFRKFYAEYKDEIKRDINGTINLPIVVYQNNGNTRIHQGTEGLEKFLGI